jgi:hypothetical protein
MACLPMRTTVTLDPDVHTLLKEAAHRSGRSFKITLNDAIRAGLKPGRQKSEPPPDWPVAMMLPNMNNLARRHRAQL